MKVFVFQAILESKGNLLHILHLLPGQPCPRSGNFSLSLSLLKISGLEGVLRVSKYHMYVRVTGLLQV